MFGKKDGNSDIVLNFWMIVILVYWLFYILYIWQSLIIPFFIALLLAMAILWLQNLYKKFKIPSSLAMILSIWTYFLFFYYIWKIIYGNIDELIKLAPSYQSKIINLLREVFDYFQIGETQVSNFISKISSNLNLTNIFNSLLSVISSISSNIMTIMFYLIFILLEAKFFSQKIELMISSIDKRRNILSVLTKIENDVKSYFFIKIIVSLLTAFLSYIIMLVFGLDFAIFWALLIFILNFIPNIWSIIAVLFPSLLSFIQPDFWIYSSLIMISLLITVQMITWNFIEPKMMWNRLNLSPLVIVLALSFWWYLWGIIWMLLSVPLMVIINIILSKFEQTRPIAIFLSEKWELEIPIITIDQEEWKKFIEKMKKKFKKKK